MLEKGAAKRFCGKPHENLRSLLLKPFFDVKIVYFFKREDFHPAPHADSVMLHLHRKPVPDIPLPQRALYQYFLEHSLHYGFSGSRALLTKRQVATALRRAKLTPISSFGDILYIQWLCFFQYWRQTAAHS